MRHVFVHFGVQLNVLPSFVATYRTTGLVMEVRGFRTYLCVPFSELTKPTMKFETNSMQRPLAENLWPGVSADALVPRGANLAAEESSAMADSEIGRFAHLSLSTILGFLISLPSPGEVGGCILFPVA